MTQRNNILEELNGMNSSLADLNPGNVYSVPSGYFEGLAEAVLNRIKVLNTENAVDELNYLSPFLNNISRETPYTVPVDYFESLDINPSIGITQTASEEIKELSPLLSSLKKDMPYEVPAGYFENIRTTASIPQTEIKVVSMGSRKWMRYAAAAIVTGIIATVSFLVFGKKDWEGMPMAKFEKKLDKEIRKMHDIDLVDFIKYSDVAVNKDEKTSVNGTDELKDIPESELKEFIEETSDMDEGSSMMN